MFLNKWTPYFDHEVDVPSMVPIWVRPFHLPLYCWNDDSLREKRNTLGKYIDKFVPNVGMFACVRICVEGDLEKGLPKVINLNLDKWNHLQK